MIYFLLVILFVGLIYFFITHEKHSFYVSVLSDLTGSENFVNPDKLLEIDLPGNQLNDLRNNIVQILRNFSIVTSFSKRLNFVSDRSNIFEFALNEILDFIQVENISILLYDEREKLLRLETVKGLAASNNPVTLKIGEGLAGIAFQEKTPIISNLGFRDPRFKTCSEREHRIRNIICVPLIVGGKAFGVLNIVNKLPADQEFTRYDIALVDAITDEVVRSIEEQNLYMEQRKKLALDSEFEIAKKIQDTYLDKVLDAYPGVKNRLMTRTSKFLGGDFYFSKAYEGDYYFVIGDVSGKGLPAALVVSGFISMIKTLVSKKVKFQDLPRDINELLMDILTEDYYVTALFVKIDFKKKIVKFINCGHERPILIFKDGRVEEMEISGFPLGLFDIGELQLHTISLDQLKRMCFLTDGILDNSSDENDQPDSLTSLKRLHHVLDSTFSRSIDEVIDTIGTEFFPEVLADDSSVVVFEFEENLK